MISSIDRYLRAHGFRILSRPSDGKPCWGRNGVIMTEAAALRTVVRERQAAAQMNGAHFRCEECGFIVKSLGLINEPCPVSENGLHAFAKGQTPTALPEDVSLAS